MERDPTIARAAKKAADGFNGSGQLNVYTCELVPGHRVVTVDREPGVTPFTIQCPYCKAAGILAERGFYKHPAMQSSMYRVAPGLAPTHEWYRPDTFGGLNPAEADHVARGGLLLREIEAAEPQAEPAKSGGAV